MKALAARGCGTSACAARGGARSRRTASNRDSTGRSSTITLTDANGAPVTSVSPGTYDFEIHDETVSHNFHLTGPGVDRRTEVADEGITTWEDLVLQPGATYHFVCDPHADYMNGSFTTSPASPPPPPPPSPPPPPGPPPPPPPPAASASRHARCPGRVGSSLPDCPVRRTTLARRPGEGHEGRAGAPPAPSAEPRRGECAKALPVRDATSSASSSGARFHAAPTSPA